MNALEVKIQMFRTLAGEPPSTECSSRPGILRSSKILDHHLDRLAIVYVRQSDPQQVLNHRESRERQYALADHAVALGWPRERVMVIDDDPGQSGRPAEQRSGFQRLLAEVSMEHVGMILGIEMSRIARNNKDWHNLLEMHTIFRTILSDEHGVYDLQDTNDRLLLGLKGTISEFELVTMRNRLERGRLHKAQRGELFHRVPTGYVKLSTERVEMGLDEQVREVVQLIFDKYDEFESAWGVFHYLIRNNVRIEFRPFHGPNRGSLEWRRPVLPTVFQILRHPIYAGAYSYGRRPHKRVRSATGNRTERRYRAVDPENRLVARSWEQRWEETLRAERQVRDDYDRFLREQPPQLTREERAQIAALSSGLTAPKDKPSNAERPPQDRCRKGAAS
jgi:DNA invertase Pin-like site-specific DNA recombinase